MRQPSEQIKIGNYSYTYANIMEDKYSSSLPNRSLYAFNSESLYGKSRDRAQPYIAGATFKKLKQPAGRSPEVAKAIDGINYVCEHLKKEDLEKIVIILSRNRV